eukprot:4194729-Alexandrium_andersonii.AAC.1
MSASLVGSEMCIRDRPGPAQRGRPGAVSPWFPGGVGARARPRPGAERPVSYTHLTLPTICSV